MRLLGTTTRYNIALLALCFPTIVRSAYNRPCSSSPLLRKLLQSRRRIPRFPSFSTVIREEKVMDATATGTTATSTYVQRQRSSCSTAMILQDIIRFLCWTVPILLWDGIRLLCFVICLSPGFIRFAWYYYITSKRKSIRYDKSSCRQSLDVYYYKVSNNETVTNSEGVNTVDTSDIELQQGLNGSNDDSHIDSRPLLQTDVESPSSLSDLQQTNLLKPVIVFYTGGAWLIGYKMWGALLARVLNSDACGNIVIVIPDLRNFPWSTVKHGMIEDCNASLQWTFNNIHEYGGDPHNIVVVGQSAGGHVACTTILKKAMSLMLSEPASSAAPTALSQPVDEFLQDEIIDNSWKPTDIKGFISLSAPYCLDGMKQTFMKHGLDDQLINRIFGLVQDNRRRSSRSDSIEIRRGDDDNNSNNVNVRNSSEDLLDNYDPYSIVRNYNNNNNNRNNRNNRNNNDNRDRGALLANTYQSLSDHLPPIKIYHGTHDKTVPHEGSELLFQELLKLYTKDGVTPDSTNSSNVNTRISFASYNGWSHTDPILEGPMDADHRFHHDLFNAVKEWTASHTARSTTTVAVEGEEQQQSRPTVGEWPEDDPIISQRLCPHVLIQIGRYCNPF